LREAHIFGSVANEQLTVANGSMSAPKSEGRLEVVIEREVKGVAIPGYMLRGRYKDFEKRRGYMREYMKKRRGNADGE